MKILSCESQKFIISPNKGHEIYCKQILIIHTVKSNYLIWFLALFFFLKALLLAFWITPLWDIPDETGHFAYARDIGNGKGIPVLGIAKIDSDILSNQHGRDVNFTVHNWIAQHPPAYHILAGILWKIAAFFTDDLEVLFKIPRILSAFSGAMVLVVIYFLLVLVSNHRPASFGFTACVGSIPMFSNMSSGTNHDITLTLFTTLAIFYWVKYLIDGRIIKYAYYTAFWLSISSFTKLTALVYSIPLLTVLLIENESPWKMRIAQTVKIFGIWIIFPGIWMFRSFYYHGKFLVTDASLYSRFRLQDNPLTDSFYKYVSELPALDNFFVSFFGLFGWTGTGKGEYLVHLVIGWQFTFYIIAVLILLLISVIYFSVNLLNGSKLVQLRRNSFIDIVSGLFLPVFEKKGIRIILLITGLLVSLSILTFFEGSTLRLTVISGIAYFSGISFFTLFIFKDPKQRLSSYTWLIFVMFAMIIFNEVYKLYLSDGQVRACHGRYFYPLISIMMTGIFIPVLTLLKQYATYFFLLLALLMAYVEMSVFLTEVLPFYLQIK